MTDMTLTKEKTNELLKKYIITKDKEIIGEIIELNQGLIHNIVKNFRWTKMEYEDLYQIACEGIIKAIKNFDISKGFSFSTYAVPMIIGEIKRQDRDDKVIHISRSEKDIINKMDRCYFILENDYGREPKEEEIAELMDISIEELHKISKIASDISISYLDEVFYLDESDNGMNKIDSVTYGRNDIEECENKIFTEELLSVLSDIERKVITERYFEDKVQTVIAQQLNISQVQVSRIEKRALKKMREFAYDK